MRSAMVRIASGISILFACLLIVLMGSFSSAQTSTLSPWLMSGSPSLEKINTIDLSRPLPEGLIGNQNCQQREVITRPKRYVHPPQAKVSQAACVADTGFGSISKTGYIQRQNSDVYGLVKTDRGDSAIMIPIPRSSTGLRISGGSSPYGVAMFFYDNLELGLSSMALANGEVTHKLPVHNAMLVNGNKELFYADTSTMSFSANGDWAVVDIPFIAMVRINTKTREVLPFGHGSNPSSGLGMAFKTAVSPDGRYAIVASRTRDFIKLYDLTTCVTPPSVITGPVTCKTRDLLPFMKEKVPGFTSLASIRFRSNYSLDLYANSMVDQKNSLTWYALVANGQQKTGFQYLALGDSFASGEGAYNYKAFTDVTDNKCHLSQRSYPYLISSALDFGQYESVACSGAVIEDVKNNSEEYRKENAQAKGMFEKTFDDQIYLGFLPGYRAQREFIGKHQPSIITLSAGGNDIGFNDIIIRCIDSDTCYDNFEDRLMLADLINKQFDPLTKMYNEVKSSADPKAKIYVIGYPQIAKVDGLHCDMNVHLNRDERVFAEQLVSYLNSVIKKAAQNAGVYYVDVESAFDGHKMCEATWAWEVAVNGLTAGNDQVNLPFVHGPIGNESYHPNALGHDLLKTKILQQTNNFTAIMPAPNPDITAGDIDTSSPFLQSPKSNKVVRKLRHYTGTDGGVMEAGKTWYMRASNLDVAFAAKSKVQAVLHSSPLNLGEYTLGSDGTIEISANLPSTLTPGWHTLHFYGKNSSGEDVDMFKTVYVTTGSTCLVPLSGQDKDKDGTDDACDGFIAQPPVVVAPPNAPPYISPIDTPAIPQQTIDQTRSDDKTGSFSGTDPTQQETSNPQPTQTIALASTTQTQASPPQTTAGPTTTNQPEVLGTTNQTSNVLSSPQLAQTLPKTEATPKPKNLTTYWPLLLLLLIILVVIAVAF